MANLIYRALRLLYQDGPKAFITTSGEYIKNRTISATLSYLRKARFFYLNKKGYYSLSASGTQVSFIATNTKEVRRNCSRYESEIPVLLHLLSHMECDDIFYDIGANTGLYTCFAAERCREGKVVAFEPYPPNAKLLKQNVSHNGYDNVDIHEVALSDTYGTIGFNQPEENDAGFGSSSINADQSGPTTEVPTKSGDEMISEGLIPAPNVLKVDVEGSEPLVLDGLENALSSPKCRLVYCEVHLPAGDHRPSVQDFGSSLDDMMDQLRSFGFTVELVQERGEEVFLKGTK